MTDGKTEAQKTWGASPTGTTTGGGFAPGTREFFEKALKFRDLEEQPWLPEVVPFDKMTDRYVLEIGFGPGYDALKFMRVGARYSGIDITPENIDRARLHLSYYDFEPNIKQGDAENIEYESGVFDVVYSNGVLHHVPDMERAFREVERVLKSGGEFFVILYNKRSVFYMLSVLLPHYLGGGFFKESLERRRSRIEFTTADSAPTVNVYSKGELVSILEGAGFQVRSIYLRKCTWEDLPASSIFGRVYRIVPASIYDFLGRVAGWYIIVNALKR
jgi:SAM-dependent methyltransferase